MTKILEVYEKYKIMPNLVEHQLRVAGVANMIFDHINDVEIDQDTIIKVCLLHDMGNIIKFKLDYFPEFLKSEGVEYWQNVQKEFIEKYGNDEHIATCEISKELGLNGNFTRILEGVGFTKALVNKESLDFNLKITEYADMRVGPYGVVSLEDRLLNLRERYNENGSTILDSKIFFSDNQREIFENAVREIEKQIFSKCDIKPEDINDISISSYIEKLKKLEI